MLVCGIVIAGTQNAYHRFLALPRDYSELDLAFLDIEDRVGRISLMEDDLFVVIVALRSSFADLG